MKHEHNRSNRKSKPIKRGYKAPVLQRFGAVADLTNSAQGTCQDDGNNCPQVGIGTMIMS